MWKTQIYRKFYYIKHLLSIFLFPAPFNLNIQLNISFFCKWNRAHNSQYQWQHQKSFYLNLSVLTDAECKSKRYIFPFDYFFFSCLVPWKIVKMFDLFMWIFVSTMLKIMLWLFMATAIFLSHTLYHSFPS